MLYETWREGVRNGVPAAVYTHRSWAEMPPEDKGFFLRLIAAGDDAFWRGWAG